jgi:hypothetical protein
LQMLANGSSKVSRAVEEGCAIDTSAINLFVSSFLSFSSFFLISFFHSVTFFSSFEICKRFNNQAQQFFKPFSYR